MKRHFQFQVQTHISLCLLVFVGTLFGKIRRVYLLFRAAAHMQHATVSAKETILIIGAVLVVDITILTIWTLVDPLEWTRNILVMDQYGNPLESEGHCTCQHWVAFAGAIAGLHFLLMGVACYLCYVARDIPTAFSEGKYLTIAMISNLQIFVIGVPVLIILGHESEAGIFVRSAIVWMNDFVVVTLIFGNLMYNAHWKTENPSNERRNTSAFIRNAMDTYIANEQQQAARRSKSSSNQGREDSYSGQDDTTFSTYDGTNVLPPSSPPHAPAQALPSIRDLPAANNESNEQEDGISSPPAFLMTVSESEQRLHVDAGDGKNIIVPIKQVKFDCTASEASDGLGQLRQLANLPFGNEPAKKAKNLKSI